MIRRFCSCNMETSDSQRRRMRDVRIILGLVDWWKDVRWYNNVRCLLGR